MGEDDKAWRWLDRDKPSPVGNSSISYAVSLKSQELKI